MQDANVIIRLKQLLAETGVSRSSAYNKWNIESLYYDPLFPQPFQIGQRSIGFKSGEVVNWIESLSKAA